MGSPVPRYLRTDRECRRIPLRFRDHVNDLSVTPKSVTASRHPAKYAPGLPTVLLSLAGTSNIGDPMAGTGRIADETGAPVALNEPDPRWHPFLLRLKDQLGCLVTTNDVRKLSWKREVLIFSPPYYPRTDRCRPMAHNDKKRGPVVGFRSTYNAENVEGFIGEPGGVNAILNYRAAMRQVYAVLARRAKRMIVVTKNWTRKGVELHLDFDTILTAQEAGWKIVRRHGWTPRPSLWARYNNDRGTVARGALTEDVLIFDRKATRAPSKARASA